MRPVHLCGATQVVACEFKTHSFFSPDVQPVDFGSVLNLVGRERGECFVNNKLDLSA